MKKAKYLLIPIIALICCCVIFLAGCSSTTVYGIALSSNWFVNVPIGGGGVQKTFTKGDDDFISEENLVYDITYEPHETTGGNYELSYEETDGKIGTYETEFYAIYIYPTTDDIFLDEYRDGYTERIYAEDDAFATVNKESGAVIAYYYGTTLETNAVTFSYTDKKTDATSEATFDGDRVVTECYFLSCDDSLRPIYSRQDIQSHAPGEYTANSVEEAYCATDREYVTYYSAEGDEATSRLTLREGDEEYEAEKESDKTVSGLDSSTIYFDVTSLEIAARAMGNLDSTLSQAIELFVPSAAEYSKTSLLEYYLVGADGDLGDCGADVTALMADAGMYKSSGEEGEVIDTVEVAVEYAGNMNGVSQTYWYAAVEKNAANVGKATLLKISSPVFNYMGTLTYTLSEIKSTSWDGTTSD